MLTDLSLALAALIVQPVISSAVKGISERQVRRAGRGCMDPLNNIVITNYSGTSLKWALTGQKFLSALQRCPPWRGLN